MAKFLGLGVWTDIQVSTPVSPGVAATRVAFFRPEELVACVATLSPTEVESLTVQVFRDDPRVAEMVVGRVLRVTHVGGTDDSEWDIASLDDSSADGVLTIQCTSIAMRLARIIYMGTTTASGQAEPDYTAIELTATEWLDLLVIPACSAAKMPFTVGTVNSTNRFSLTGEWTSVLEIIHAIAAKGNATAEFKLTAGGTWGYVIDLLTTIGSSADTVRVRTAVNLIETKRQRSMLEVATVLYPRGASTSVATRTMTEHLWRVATKTADTSLTLEDAWGGAPPIIYDDQVNGLYLASLNDFTFASFVITDSVASTDSVVLDATTFAVGDYVRFFVGSGATGARVTSLTHPTLVLSPTVDGYGSRGQILDRPGINADTNLVKNGTMGTWTTPADPPDGWAEYAAVPASVAFTRETSDTPSSGLDAFKVVITGTVFGEYTGAAQRAAAYVESPIAPVWDSTTRRYTATVWIKVTSGTLINIYLHDGTRAGESTLEAHLDAALIGQWVGGVDAVDTWIRYESAALTSISSFSFPNFTSGPVTVRVEPATGSSVPVNTTGVWRGPWDVGTSYNANDWVSTTSTGNFVWQCISAPSLGADPTTDAQPGGDWSNPVTVPRIATGTFLVSAVTVAESTTAIADREGSGGTQLWQSVNAAFPTQVSAVKGYDLAIADLWADDATTYATLKFVPGGTVEVTDTDLDITTSLRLVEYQRDYLRPLASVIRVGEVADVLTALVEGAEEATTEVVSITTDLGLRVTGKKVIGAQGAAVADATSAATAITQVNLLLARARAHGLIAT